MVADVAGVLLGSFLTRGFFSRRLWALDIMLLLAVAGVVLILATDDRGTEDSATDFMPPPEEYHRYEDTPVRIPFYAAQHERDIADCRKITMGGVRDLSREERSPDSMYRLFSWLL